MSRIDFNNMNSVIFDVLREMGNIGAGNATTALAKMLDVRIDMKVPRADILTFNELTTRVAAEEEVIGAVLLAVEGDIDGVMMFVLDMKSARYLSSILLGGNSDSEQFSEMEMSAIKEIGNIITGSYLTAISELTHLKLKASVPELKFDMAAALLSVVAIEFGKIGDKVLLLDTEFDTKEQIRGFFILIPELESYDKILESLGV